MQKIDPTLLPKLPDEKLVENVKLYNCSESFKELSSRHVKLYSKVANKYAAYIPPYSGMNNLDFYQDRDWVFLQTIQKFDPTRGVKFNTYLWTQVKHYCQNQLTKLSPLYSCDENELLYLIDKNGQVENDDAKKEKIEYIFNILKQLKDQRIIKVFKMRYLIDDKKKRSWAYIGKQIKLSSQGAINLHNHALEFLKEKLKSSNINDIV